MIKFRRIQQPEKKHSRILNHHHHVHGDNSDGIRGHRDPSFHNNNAHKKKR